MLITGKFAKCGLTSLPARNGNYRLNLQQVWAFLGMMLTNRYIGSGLVFVEYQPLKY